MPVNENQICESGRHCLQYTARYLWQVLVARDILDCGMAAVDHRSWARMEADRFPEVFRSFSKIPQHQCGDIPSSAAKQSNNISCSVIAKMRDSAIPVSKIAAANIGTFTRRFSSEYDEIMN